MQAPIRSRAISPFNEWNDLVFYGTKECGGATGLGKFLLHLSCGRDGSRKRRWCVVDIPERDSVWPTWRSGPATRGVTDSNKDSFATLLKISRPKHRGNYRQLMVAVQQINDGVPL